LIYFLGMLYVIGSVLCGLIQCQIYVYNIYSYYYVVIISRDKFNISTVLYSYFLAVTCIKKCKNKNMVFSVLAL
jgi:hypothetical protein